MEQMNGELCILRLYSLIIVAMDPGPPGRRTHAQWYMNEREILS